MPRFLFSTASGIYQEAALRQVFTSNVITIRLSRVWVLNDKAVNRGVESTLKRVLVKTTFSRVCGDFIPKVGESLINELF